MYVKKRRVSYVKFDSGFFVRETVTRYIENTIDEIDKTILKNYVCEQKITPKERQAFQQSLQTLLAEHANGGCTNHYFDYLSESLDTLEDMEEYMQNYRTKFEYVAKTAKTLFSASIENAFSSK